MMNLSLDARLQQLNQLIQIEQDPEKLMLLTDEFSDRLEQLQEIDRAKPDQQSPRDK